MDTTTTIRVTPPVAADIRETSDDIPAAALQQITHLSIDLASRAKTTTLSSVMDDLGEEGYLPAPG